MALPMPPINNHARRPTCTHMMMRRLYGDYTCCLCGRVPPMRWVYLCHQDVELRHMNNNPPSSASIVQDESNYFQSMAALARRLKMSSSIVESIQAGRYTFEQVDVLIAQKEHVNATIRAQQNQASSPAPTFGNVLQSHDPSATSNIGTAPPSIPPGFGHTTLVEALLNLPVGCGFRVCHTCRPQFLERATISLASALNGETPPIMEAEVKYLRVLDANILKNVGLREHVPTHKFIGEPDGSSDWTATSSSDEISSDESSDSCLDAALTHDGALSTPPRQHHQLAYDTPGRSTASSISLPTPSTPSLPSVPKHNHETHRRSCSTGSEVEVRGGVALTEEAVGNGMPDLLT